jgi:hypothetical protein
MPASQSARRRHDGSGLTVDDGQDRRSKGRPETEANVRNCRVANFAASVQIQPEEDDGNADDSLW